jgi:hypothetical protein
VKSTEKTTTSIKLRLDCLIGQVLPNPPWQAKAHLISVIGGDTQIAAVSAAISMGDRFMVEGPDLAPTRACLERNAQCFKGSIQLTGRGKPLRHRIAISEEFVISTARAESRTLLAGSDSHIGWESWASFQWEQHQPIRTRNHEFLIRSKDRCASCKSFIKTLKREEIYANDPDW